MARTQKARGVLNGLPLLLDKFSEIKSFFFEKEHILIDTNPNNIIDLGFPFFARPCPLKPRHGFIESRVINSYSALNKLWAEVKKVDKYGEILLGPYIKNVKYNAVYVDSGLLSVGVGNAGATGGKNSISFPVAPIEFTKCLKNKSGLNKKDTVYIEAVNAKVEYGNNYNCGILRGDTGWLLTQIRGGPRVDSAHKDYIPYKVIVKNIVTPCDDLLEWEKKAKKFNKGTVVYGNGHTLASHAAIHCILNKIPFITSKKPVIGQSLEQINNKDKAISRSAFRNGVRVGVGLCKKIHTDDMLKLFYFSLSVLHNWAYLKNSENAGWLLGAACATYMSLCSALLSGECRHYKNADNYGNRDTIYSEALCAGTKGFNNFSKIALDFCDIRHWDSGFGGVPWATCAWYSSILWSKVSKACHGNKRALSDDEVKDIITAVNKSVNTAHNNGWWFNKIASCSSMDFIAKNSGLGAFCVADIYFKLATSIHKYKKNKILRAKSLPKLPCVEDKNGNLFWAKVCISSGPCAEIVLWKNSTRYGSSKYFDMPDNSKANKFADKHQHGHFLYPLNKNFTISFPGCKPILIKKGI